MKILCLSGILTVIFNIHHYVVFLLHVDTKRMSGFRGFATELTNKFWKSHMLSLHVSC